MVDYINRDAFVTEMRKRYCDDCDHRKGFENGKPTKIVYEIGDAPCRACGIDDMIRDVEDWPSADVVERKRGGLAQKPIW